MLKEQNGARGAMGYALLGTIRSAVPSGLPARFACRAAYVLWSEGLGRVNLEGC